MNNDDYKNGLTEEGVKRLAAFDRKLAEDPVSVMNKILTKIEEDVRKDFLSKFTLRLIKGGKK